MKQIAILGSTGSIGQSTLNVVRHLHDQFKVSAIAARSNIDLLEKQAKEFCPEIVGVFDKQKALELKSRLPMTKVVGGIEGLQEVASYSGVELVISAIAGTLGLVPTLSAIQSGKNVGLANKEALVSGGHLVMSLVKEHKIQLFPLDSEHSAIFQCLNGEQKNDVKRLILTASGGPFRNFNYEQLQNVGREQALSHPTWKMGPKITIDCSTLMNKGLEVIEAHWLFDMAVEDIDVIVHPQSIIHSLVEFHDGALMAQMGEPSMEIPIQYAMTYPNRIRRPGKRFDFLKHSSLQFFAPDMEKFPCLKLAYQAIQAGGSLPCYMNAANEVLVSNFIDGKISWIDISIRLEKLMNRHSIQSIQSIEDVLNVDQQARKEADEI